MNLNKELHLNDFQDLLEDISMNLEDDVYEMEKKIKIKKQLIESLNQNALKLNVLSYQSDSKTLMEIRTWAEEFEDNVYQDENLFHYEKQITPLLCRFQNIYNTEDILSNIENISMENKEELVNKFPVIKIWNDNYSDHKSRKLIIEYYKYQIILQILPDNKIYQNSLFLRVLNDIPIVIDLDGFYDNLSISDDNLNNNLVQNIEKCPLSIVNEFKLGLLLVLYFYEFNFRDYVPGQNEALFSLYEKLKLTETRNISVFCRDEELN